MTIRLFLPIMGTLGVVHGVAFVVAPDQGGLQPTIPVANRWGLDPWLTKNFRDEVAVFERNADHSDSLHCLCADLVDSSAGILAGQCVGSRRAPE